MSIILLKGTFGYLDPDYTYTGRLTRKSDVYSFGVVLFEVLCRKRAVDKSIVEEQWDLVRWAQGSIKKGALNHIIDYDIRDQISPKCLKEFVQMAERCLHSTPKQRPTMSEVVVSLDSILALQEKNKNSLQPVGRNMFGGMLDMFPFPSSGENSAHADSKLSSDSNDRSGSASNTVGPNNNMCLDKSEVPADCRIPSPSLKDFKLANLKSATRDFGADMLLGEGGFAKVFLGWVDKNTFAPSNSGVGIAVAVKRYDPEIHQHNPVSHQRNRKYLIEVSLWGWLAHPNIISLLGHCCFKNKRLLVYEYMQKGSLRSFLIREAPVVVEPLSWRRLLTIMIGVARGLAYLHSSKDQILLRSLTTSDILLDQDFNAKLAAFGLARSGPEIGNEHVTISLLGTLGYIDPEYARTGHLSAKSDIYSFGVVLLETLTALRVLDRKRPGEQRNLVVWAMPILTQKRVLKKMVDPRLEQNYPPEGALELATLALRCVALKPKGRPSSEEVLWCLEQIYAFHN